MHTVVTVRYNYATVAENCQADVATRQRQTAGPSANLTLSLTLTATQTQTPPTPTTTDDTIGRLRTTRMRS
jgi:hypothetical protein